MDDASSELLPISYDLTNIITTIKSVGFSPANSTDEAVLAFTRETDTSHEELTLTHHLEAEGQASGQMALLLKYRPHTAVTDDQTITLLDSFVDPDPHQWASLVKRLRVK